VSKLVFVTQQVDAAHPTLGAAAAMVRALAERLDEVVVLAGAAAAEPLPANVRIRSFAAPAQALRGARFEAALIRELLRGRPTAVLAHMSPIYAVLAAPLLRPLRVPLLLWFTQQGSGPSLRRAERAVEAILTVDRRAVPLSSPKVRAIGHGIDTTQFNCAERAPREGPLRLLSLGRYAEVKGHDVALRALRRLVDEGVDAKLTIRGEEATPNDALVRGRLASLVGELGLDGRARLLDALPRPQVPALLTETDVLVNATHGPTADKVVFEAAACCVPPVASSPVFEALLPAELRFRDGEEATLAAAVRAAGALTAEARRELRARVEASHSVGHWADAVLGAARLPRG
jgi:glycosyltransferase involved in cell wall biosynthesis